MTANQNFLLFLEYCIHAKRCDRRFAFVAQGNSLLQLNDILRPSCVKTVRLVDQGRADSAWVKVRMILPSCNVHAHFCWSLLTSLSSTSGTLCASSHHYAWRGSLLQSVYVWSFPCIAFHLLFLAIRLQDETILLCGVSLDQYTNKLMCAEDKKSCEGWRVANTLKNSALS